MPIRTFKIGGISYDVYRSNKKDKKYKVNVGDEEVHFGAKGYTIAPGTMKGDRYCARSFGIKGKDNIRSANFWSRKMWDCRGKKSMR